jgi:peptide/nickel transport system permease protein
MSLSFTAPGTATVIGARATLRRFRRSDFTSKVGVVLVTVVLFLAFAGPWLAPTNPLTPSTDLFAAPTWSHVFGTDRFGRDILARVLNAFRVDVLLAIAAVLGALCVGTIVGAVCGYAGGLADDVFMRVVDVCQCLPMLVMALILVAFMGAGVVTVIIVTAVINAPVFARLARSDILVKKHIEFIDAARCSGCTPTGLVARHLIPNILGPLVVQGSVTLALAVLNVAALSFLGVGINPPTPELGVMVAEGGTYLAQGVWWMSVYPGIALVLAIFAFNLVGDLLQDRLDPRRRAI